MVRMEVDYLKELRWPGKLEIGTAVVEFGRTSFKAVQGIFHDGVCAASGQATLVCMDLKTRKATPLPQAAIERLSRQVGYEYEGTRVRRTKTLTPVAPAPAR